MHIQKLKEKIDLSEETFNQVLTVLLLITAVVFIALLLQKLDMIPRQEIPRWIAAPLEETNEAQNTGNSEVAYEGGGVDEALQPPNPDASEEQRRVHFELVQRLAEVSSTLTLSSECAFSPKVLEFPESGVITVVNENTTEYPMVFTEEFRLTIPANGSVTVQASEFPHGAGVYGYGCGKEPGPSGLIHVPPTVAPTSQQAQ